MSNDRRNSVVKCARSFIVIGACVLLQFASGAISMEEDIAKRETIELVDDDTQSFLMKFGYLSPMIDGVAALRTEDSLREAIKKMQQFGNIPVTGRLDEKTKKLMRTPRCGVPDFDTSMSTGRSKRYILHNGQPWRHHNLTWHLTTTNVPNVNTYEAREVFKRALDLWAKHSKLTFTELNSVNADIVISFVSGDHGDRFHFDGKGQVLAHAFFPGTGRGGDAHFDSDETWLTQDTDSDSDGTSLFKVAAHEFGHSLGIQHSDVMGALMAPYYQAFSAKDYELPEDDKLAIQALYGVKDYGRWDRIPKYPYYPFTTTTSTTTTTTTTTTQRPRYKHVKHPPKKTYYYPTPTTRRIPYTYTTTRPRYNYHSDKQPTVRYSSSYDPHKKYNKERNKQGRRVDKTVRKEYEKKPNMCSTDFDAASVIRGEVFFFKNQYLWRIGERGLHRDYPVLTTRMFPKLPENFTRVDAVYENPDNKIVIFIGRYYYVYSMTSMIKLEPGYPQPLTSLGLPSRLNKVDGATVWGHNGKTFFFSDHEYWRFDDDSMKVEPDYPRNVQHTWKGIPNGIDAVFQWKDGKTYFFKGTTYWKFNDIRMNIEPEYPRPIGGFWFGCSLSLEDSKEKEPYTAHHVSSCDRTSIANLATLLLVALLASL